VNLEFLAKVVFQGKDHAGVVAFPDTLVGTDSHTTMINGLGVLGWGVGGIEAEANMLGQPLYMLMPEVVGMKLTGRLSPGATATDLVLRVTEILRKEGVVNKFVEFFGEGVSSMSLADRATIANMAPEYGATMGFFPVDAETLNYLRRTGRTKAEVDLVERYTKEQQLFRTDDGPEPKFTKVLSLDMSTVEPSLAGPKRPQDLVPLRSMKSSFRKSLSAPVAERGFAVDEAGSHRTAQVIDNGHSATIGHGAVVIAAITSCTNTSNPSVMIAAGLLAKKAVAKGLKSKSYVKTSLAPGSRVVTDYFDKAGLTAPLDALGFYTVGYGCTTCIGNSGPLPAEISKVINDHELVVASALSGNRNFEGRVHPEVRANYLASPPLVVAFALAGKIDIDFETEPLGIDPQGKAVFLKELWPTQKEIKDAIASSVKPETFRRIYADVYNGDLQWRSLKVPTGDLFSWDSKSTYVKNPPYFDNMPAKPAPVADIKNARVLALLGDSITTDHISPAGSIKKDSPAGKYLMDHGVQPADFNQYGARRGNDEVMVRGTFANVRLKNKLAPGTEGGVTRHLPDGAPMSIFDAAMLYKKEATPLVILAGKEYGSGSSRDWAAKGPYLLGIKVVIAESFERIHRSNLVGMGILPLQFKPGENPETLGLTGEEVYSFDGLPAVLANFAPGKTVTVTALKADGTTKTFTAIVRIDTPGEVGYYEHGGILHFVLRQLLAAGK
ncbi:MAG: aconitate hydratase AcnA, partial [Planctomycetota bacterium]